MHHNPSTPICIPLPSLTTPHSYKINSLRLWVNTLDDTSLGARECLRAAFEDAGISLTLDEILEKKNYLGHHKLIHKDVLKSFTFSLSHTKSLSLCLLSPSTFDSSQVYIGVDVEESTRQVSQRVIQKISHPQDQFDLNDSLQSLKIWTQKEAAFKCLSNAYQSNFHLKDVILQKNSRFSLDSNILTPSQQQETYVYSFMATPPGEGLKSYMISLSLLCFLKYRF